MVAKTKLLAKRKRAGSVPASFFSPPLRNSRGQPRGWNGKSPSVAAILLGRRQAEEIAKTRAPPRPVFVTNPCESSAWLLYREMLVRALRWPEIPSNSELG